MITEVKLIDFIKAMYVNQLEKIETSATEFTSLFDIDSQEGVSLDLIGGLVQQSRNGLSDNEYRIYLKAAALRNSSTGRTNDVITALEILTSDPNSYIIIHPMAIDVYADVSPEEAVIIKKFMEDVVMAGVKILTVQPATAPGCFGFEGAPDSETFGSTTDPTVGGNFSYIIV